MIRIDINEYLDIIIETDDKIEALYHIGDMLTEDTSCSASYLCMAGDAVQTIGAMLINKDINKEQAIFCLTNIIGVMLQMTTDPETLNLLSKLILKLK